MVDRVLDISSDISMPLIASPLLLGTSAAVGILTLSLLLTWAAVYTFYVPTRSNPTSKSKNTSGNTLVVVQLKFMGVVFFNTIIDRGKDVVSTTKEIGSNIVNYPTLAAAIPVLLAGSLLYINYHTTLHELKFEAMMCYVQPALNSVIYPLISSANVAYTGFIAVWNATAEITYAAMLAVFRLVVSCSTVETVLALVKHIGFVAYELVLSTVRWLALELFSDGRLELMDVFITIGDIFTEIHPILSCVCSILDPVWTLLVAFFNLPTLHAALDALINVATRVLQLATRTVIKWETISIHYLVIELNAFLISFGETIEDTSVLLVTFLMEIYAILSNFILGLVDLISGSSFIEPATLKSLGIDRDIHLRGTSEQQAAWRLATQATFGLDLMRYHIEKHDQIQLAAAIADALNQSEPMVFESSYVRGLNYFASSQIEEDVVYSTATVAHLRRIIAAYDDNTTTASGERLRYSRIMMATWHQNVQLRYPDAKRVSLSARNEFQFWDFMSALGMIVMLGLSTLQRLLSTPYSHIISEPYAAALSAINMTVEIVFNPTESLIKQSGVRYFQFGHIGDRFRVAAESIAQLTVVIEAKLPCVLAEPLKAVVSMIEGVLEFFIYFLAAIFFRPWTIGKSDVIDCTTVTCSPTASVPADWTLFDSVADYYAWENNRMRRTLHDLLVGGECQAHLFGCDTAAPNNNNTNATVNNCAEAPAGCLSRSINGISVAVVNTTLSTMMYFFDLVRFDATRKTFKSLPFNELHAAFVEMASCLSNFIDTTDVNDENCITTDAPEEADPGDGYAGDIHEPTLDLGSGTIPARHLWTCRTDGFAYYHDDTVVLVYNMTTGLDSLKPIRMPCNYTVGTLCSVGGNSLVQFQGSYPITNISIAITPRPNWGFLSLSYGRTLDGDYPYQSSPHSLGLSLLPPEDQSNVVVNMVNDEVCSLPNLYLPAPTPMELGCRNDETIFVDYDPYISRRIARVRNNEDDSNVIPCTTRLSPNVQCIGGVAHYNDNGLLRELRITIGEAYQTEVAIECTTSNITGETMLVDVGCLNNRAVAIIDMDTFAAPNATITRGVFFSRGAQKIPLTCQSNYLFPEPIQCGSIPSSGNFSYCAPGEECLYMEGLDGPINPSFEIDNVIYPIPCEQNIQGPTTEPPTCIDQTFHYISTNTSSVLHIVNIRIESAQVRITIDGVVQEMPCQYAMIQATGANYGSTMHLSGDDGIVYSQITGLPVEVDLQQQRIYDRHIVVSAARGETLDDGRRQLKSLVKNVMNRIKREDAMAQETRIMFKPEDARWLRAKMLPSVNDDYDGNDDGDDNIGISTAGVVIDPSRRPVSPSLHRLRPLQSYYMTSERVKLGHTHQKISHYTYEDTTVVDASRDDAAAQTILISMANRVWLANSSTTVFYRKETLTCCVSDVLRYSQLTVISTVFEAIHTAMAVLHQFADNSEPFPLPTFVDARNHLRTALCKFACMVTRFIPTTFMCDPLTRTTGCGSGATCTQGLMCNIFIAAMLPLDIIGDILLTIRQAIFDDDITSISPNENALGVQCSKERQSDCVISVIAYLVTKLLVTILNILRAASAIVDCVICALIKLGNPNAGCTAIVFSIVDPICTLVEQIIELVILTVLKIVVGVIECLIYLFTGRFQELLDAFVNNILNSIAILIGSVFKLIIGFLMTIPGIDKIVGFILTLARGVCDAINWLVRMFNVRLDCDSIPRDNNRKRSIIELTWFNYLPEYIKEAWVVGGGAYMACNVSMDMMRNIAIYDILDESRKQDDFGGSHLMYCLAAHFWTNATYVEEMASSSGAYFNRCDFLMTGLYREGMRWEDMDTLLRAEVATCGNARLSTEEARSVEGGEWIPHDLAYNNFRFLQLIDDLAFAHGIYAQYASDHDVDAAHLVSGYYRDQWMNNGYDISHLDEMVVSVVQLTGAANIMGVSAETVYDYVANSTSFEIDAYIDRALVKEANHKTDSILKINFPWRTHRDRFSAKRIRATVKHVIVPIFAKNSDHLSNDGNTNDTAVYLSMTNPEKPGKNEKLVAYLGRRITRTMLEHEPTINMGQLSAFGNQFYAGTTRVIDTVWGTTISSSTQMPIRTDPRYTERMLKQSVGGICDVFFYDLPSIAARIGHWSMVSADALDSYIATLNAGATPEPPFATHLSVAYNALFFEGALFDAIRGLQMFVRDTVTGGIERTGQWLNQPSTIAWLQANRHTRAQHVPKTMASVSGRPAHHESDMITVAMANLVKGFASIAPVNSPMYAVASLVNSATEVAKSRVQRANEELTEHGRIITPLSGATQRRLKLSQFSAAVGLAMAAATSDLHGISRHPYTAAGKIAAAQRTHTVDPVVYNASVASRLHIAAPQCMFYLPDFSGHEVALLCDICLLLDNYLGRIMNAVIKALEILGILASRQCRLNPGDPDCVEDPHRISLQKAAMKHDTMLAYFADESQPLYIGDSPALPARWPWRDYDNWRILGDPTPNKMRFDDIRHYASVTYEYIASSTLGGFDFNNIGDSIGNIFKSQAQVKPRVYSDGASINSIAAGFAYDAYTFVQHKTNWTSQLLPDISQGIEHPPLPAQLVTQYEPSPGRGVAWISGEPPMDTQFNSLSDVAFAWGSFFYYMVGSCDYTHELDGTQKRFSIGEIIFAALALTIVIAIITQTIVPQNLLVLAGGLPVVFTIVLVVLTLSGAYNWSYFCMPAMPAPLGNDITHFVFHTLVPQCPLDAGMIAEDDYDNSNCRACDGWRTGTSTQRWHVPDYFKSHADGGQFGFSDLTYNIVFLLQMYAPGIMDWLRTEGSEIPILNTILDWSIIRSRLNAYSGMSRETMTPIAFSQYMLGSTWVTLAANGGIAIAALLGLVMLWPMVMFAARLIIALVQLAVVAVFLAVALLVLLGELAIPPVGYDENARDPDDEPIDPDKQQHDDDDDDIDNNNNDDNNKKNVDRRRSNKKKLRDDNMIELDVMNQPVYTNLLNRQVHKLGEGVV